MPRSKAAKSRRTARHYDIVLAYMVAKYPGVFFPRGVEPRALKVGIMADLLADNPQVPRHQINQFIALYTRKQRYYRAVVDNVFRVDLQGNAAQKVADNAKRFAREQIEKRQAEKRQRAAEAASAVAAA